jgi:hypothetical protein
MMIEPLCIVRIPMLRTRNDQPSLFESVLPEVCLRLPAELERVDAWLDDERFFAPVWGAPRRSAGSAECAAGDVPAVDVPQVPLPDRV